MKVKFDKEAFWRRVCMVAIIVVVASLYVTKYQETHKEKVEKLIYSG